MGKFQELVEQKGYKIEPIKTIRVPTDEEYKEAKQRNEREAALAAIGMGTATSAATGGLLAGLPGLEAAAMKPVIQASGPLDRPPVIGQTGFTAGTEQQVLDRKVDTAEKTIEGLEGKYAEAERKVAVLSQSSDPADWEQLEDAQAEMNGYLEQLTAAKDDLGALEWDANNRLVFEADMEEVGKWSAEEIAAAERYFETGRNSEIPKSLVDRYGGERLEELLESYRLAYNQQKSQEYAAKGEELGKSLGIFGVVPQVGAGLVGTAGNLLGFVGTGGSTARNGTGRYKGPDPYRSGTWISDWASGVGKGAAEKTPEQLVDFLEVATQAVNPYADTGSTSNYRPQLYDATRGTKAGEVIDTVGSGAYQVVNTAADTVARAYLGGKLFGAGTNAAKAFSLGLAGARSYNDTFNSVLRRGGTAGQAVVLGIFNGGTEIATEYIPLDEWWKIAKNGSGSVAAALKAAARQGAMEMTQEEIGFLATTMAEYAVLREKSEYQVLLRELMAQGIPKEEAERMVWEEFGRQAAGVAATSFFSGGLSTAGAQAFQALMPGAVTQEQTAQTEQAPQTQQTQQTPFIAAENAPAQAQETAPAAETVFEPQTPLQVAQENYRQNSTVSNSQAEAILADSGAVAVLQREAGLELGGTKAQDRAAVKAAVARLTVPTQAAQDTATDLAESIASDFAEDRTESRQAAQEPQGDVDAAVDTALRGETYQRPQTARSGKTTPTDRLWTTNRGARGWGSLTGNSVWAVALAVKEVNPELFAVYERAGESATISPVLDAVIAASQDVRQGTVSPMAAATVISRVHSQNGEKGLTQMVRSGDGNLQDNFLAEMRNIDTGHHRSYDKNKEEGGADNGGQKNREGADRNGHRSTDKTDPAGRGGRSPEKSGEGRALLYREGLPAGSRGEDVLGKGARRERGLTDYDRFDGTVKRDNEGRTIRDGLADKLIGTTVIDMNGAPIAVYHGTPEMVFTEFSEGQAGHHFGTDQQAVRRMVAKMDASSDRGRVFRTYLNIKNPAHIDADIGRWDAFATALLLRSGGWITDQDLQEVAALATDNDTIRSPATQKLHEVMRRNDIDGIVYPNAIEGEGLSYMVLDNSQIVIDEITEYDQDGRKAESYEQKKPAMGAADRGFTLKSAMIDAYGEIPEGENPVRPDQLPRSTDGTDRVSYTARTALEAEATPAEFVPLIENNTMRGQFSFIPITNSDTVRRATETIRADGWRAALTDWTAAVRQGQAGADITAMGALLYNNAVNSGDFRQALDILTDYQLAVRNSAQALQAARILKTLTPSDRLYCIRRSIRRMVDDLGLDVDIQIDEDLARQYQEAGTDEEADEILDLIVQDIARQIPPTLGERITALRYLNMLGNFRTQIRNMVGNIGAQLTYLAKDEIGAAFEQMVSWVNPNFDRTKSFITDRETRMAAADDYENVAEWVSNGGRYNDAGDVGGGFAQRVQDARRILPPGLEQYRRATNWAMNNQYFGDAAFGRMAYARALAGYLNARGIHTNDLSTVDQATLAAAREYAVRQAQEATFRDNNEVSTWASNAMRGRNNPTWARVLGDAVMPFRKTPANVLVRAEEFSPLGLINSAVNTVRAARGRISGAELIESWAKSVTGTGLFVLGYALANMGFLRGGPSDDEDERTMDDLVGYQDYALVLPGGTNLTIDFFSPAAVPALLGAQLSEVLADGGITWDEIDEVILSMADPMVDMSMLQGLNDLFENLRYSDMPLGQIFADAALSYVTQALGNTLMGQLERSTEQNRMTTYVDKGSKTPEWLQRALGKLSQKIPGWDYQQSEYIDRWGRTEENPKGITNLVYQLFSPAYFDKAEVDELAAEIYRLNDAQSDVSVVPRAADKKLTFTEENGTVHKDYTLSKEEYDTLARVQGQTAKELLTEIVGSAAYAAMTDTQKAEVFSMVYDYAREKARDEAIEGYAPNYSDWMKALAEDGVSSIYRRAATSDISGGFTGWWTAKNAADREKGLEELKSGLAVYDGLSAADKKKAVEEATGRTKYLLLAHDKGMSADKFLTAYEQHQRYDDMNISASDKAEKWAIYLQSQREKGVITMAQETVLREKMQFYSQFPGKAEKVDLLRESGLSSSEIYDVTHGIDLLRPIEGNTDVTPYQRYEVIAGSGLSDAETDAVMLAYMPDYDPNKKGSDRTELKYKDIRGRGYSPEEYVDLYGVYRDGGGKWAIINAISALPYVKSYQEAVLLYSIFEGDYYKSK